MKIGKYNVVKSLNLPFPNIYSGDAFALSVTANDRITRILTGSNLTNTSYLQFRLPPDFVGFPENAVIFKSRKSNASCNCLVSLGKNGNADSIVNNLSMIATGLSLYEEKTSNIGSSYLPNDLIVLTVVSTTPSGSQSLDIVDISINYIGK